MNNQDQNTKTMQLTTALSPMAGYIFLKIFSFCCIFFLLYAVQCCILPVRFEIKNNETSESEMKRLTVKRNNDEVRLSGNGAFEIREKISKYGFKFDWDRKEWVGNVGQLEIVVKYINNFKSSEIEIEG